MKRIFCILLAFTILICFAGCSEIEQYSAETDKVIPEEINYPVTAENITFEKAPEKVVSLSPAITHIMCEFGFENYLVGISEYCDRAQIPENTAVLGSPANPDIEGILALSPELLLTQSPISLTDRTRLESNNIKIIYVQSPNGLNELIDYYAMISMIFMGNGYYNDATKDKFVDFDKAFGEAESKQMNFKFIYILTDDMAVATGDTLAGDILSVYGENIASDNENLSIEVNEIIEQNPDIIFIADDVDIEKLPDSIKTLKAFENNVIRVDNEYFEKATTDIAKLISNLTLQLEAKLTL